MTKINDGGPAFPPAITSTIDGVDIQGPFGMSLRDYFAGQVLQGELSAQSAEEGHYYRQSFPKLAEFCFEIADAMLKARGGVDE